MSQVTLTVTSRCSRCAKEHTQTTESDHAHAVYPPDPPLWLVKFAPPGPDGKCIEFRMWCCDACAQEIGGTTLANLRRPMTKEKTR